MLEKQIESYFIAQCKKLGILQYKFTSPSCRSVPDRLLIHKGKTVYIEFKATGKTPTEKQLAEHYKIRAKGAEVYVIDSKELVDSMLESVLKN